MAPSTPRWSARGNTISSGEAETRYTRRPSSRCRRSRSRASSYTIGSMTSVRFSLTWARTTSRSHPRVTRSADSRKRRIRSSSAPSTWNTAPFQAARSRIHRLMIPARRNDRPKATIEARAITVLSRSKNAASTIRAYGWSSSAVREAIDPCRDPVTHLRCRPSLSSRCTQDRKG